MTARFIVALLCSLLMHFVLLAGPAWHLPRLAAPQPPPPALAAILRSPTVHHAQRAAPPASRRKTLGEDAAARPLARMPEHSAAQPANGAIVDPPAESIETMPLAFAPAETSALPTAPLPEVDDDRETDARPADPAPSSSAVEPPRALRLVFNVTRGERGFVVGRAEHRLHIADGEYRIATELATTGLAALFRPAQASQHSAGHLANGVLRPLTFRSNRRGQSEETHFDWQNHRLHLADGRALALPDGTQDLLSLFYQLALTEGKAVELPVTTGRKLERYRFENNGEVLLDTPFGERRTLHWRTQGAREATEVWLGIEERLPLRIRHIDRHGEIFDQNIERIIAEESAP